MVTATRLKQLVSSPKQRGSWFKLHMPTRAVRKKSKACACGCGRYVKPSRLESGQSWRICVLGKYLIFWSTQCLVRAACENVSWRLALAAALRRHAPGRGNRGVVATALREIESLDGLADPGPVAIAPARFERAPLQRYMDLLLLACFEWHLRLGFLEARPWYDSLLRKFAGRKQWLQQRRCTVWALLDTTAVYMIAHYLRKLPGTQALLCIVVGTVCCNSWRSLAAVFGSAGVPNAVTALQLATLQAAAKKKHPTLSLSPTGGLTGSGRLTLGAFARELRLQRSTGNNSEHFFTFVGQLFAEHCGAVVVSAFESISRIAGGDDDAAAKNLATLEVLRTQFYLYGLCQEHVARLVGVLIPGAFDCSRSDYVGERARIGLNKLLKPEVRPQTLQCRSYSNHLRSLADTVQRELPRHAAKRTTPAAWRFLETHLPPGIPSFLHLQLHEHNCCEFVKNEDFADRTGKGGRGEPTAAFPDWTRSAYPDWPLWPR